jgi:hypothetical protein
MAVVGGGVAVELVVVDDACGEGPADCDCVLQPAATKNAMSIDTANLAMFIAANYPLCGGDGSHSIN